MYIIHITSEVAPIAKVGGLADVVFGMARETQKKGHVVEVFIPKYDSIDHGSLSNLRPIYHHLWSYDGTHQYHNTVWGASLLDINLLLLESHHPSYWFNRGSIYGSSDDVDRFIYFSRTALEYLFKAGKQPDVIHIHDWPTAAVAVLYKEMYIPLGLCVGQGIVLTIHNLQYQGRCKPHNLTRAGLRGYDYLDPNKLQDPINPEDLNLLKGGIQYADCITTVSPTYKREMQTEQGGYGLHRDLIQCRDKLKGILNGIDFDYWNPETDEFLFKNYDIKTAVLGKHQNKNCLRKQYKLKVSKGPLICCISRLDPQKGLGLIVYTLKYALEKGAQFILLGSSPNPDIEVAFKDLQLAFNQQGDVLIHLEQDEALAHQVYAAADMIIIPSFSEPCGLTQMIALRYGTVPIVRMTGGLADSIFDIDYSESPLKIRNGFSFKSPDISSLEATLDRALSYYRKASQKWIEIMEAGMQTDFSWKDPLKSYIDIYSSLKS